MNNPNGIILHAVVADLHDTLHDIHANRRWFWGAGIGVIVYTFASSGVFQYAESSQMGSDGNLVTMSYWQAFVFTVLNLTCGFARVVPTSTLGEVVALLNAVVGLLIFGLIVAIIAHSLAPAGSTSTSLVGGVGGLLAQLPLHSPLATSGAMSPTQTDLDDTAIAVVGQAEKWNWLLKGRRLTADEVAAMEEHLSTPVQTSQDQTVQPDSIKAEEATSSENGGCPIRS